MIPCRVCSGVGSLTGAKGVTPCPSCSGEGWFLEECEMAASEIEIRDAVLSSLKADLAEATAALKACMAYIPCSQVRSWPPGFKLKDEAMRLASGVLKKLEGS